jgi:hypothetical protein
VIVIAFPTVMDGLVLRWYRDLTAAEIGDESMSASRAGVKVNVFQHEIPEQQMNDASEAYATLSRGGDVEGVVTHRFEGFAARRKVVPLGPKGGPWTSHGHSVEGVTVVGSRPPMVARCGGPALCSTCRADAERIRREAGRG